VPILGSAIDYDFACVLIARRRKRWLSDGKVGVTIQAARERVAALWNEAISRSAEHKRNLIKARYALDGNGIASIALLESIDDVYILMLPRETHQSDRGRCCVQRKIAGIVSRRHN
jgi:hypothetical protein